VALALRPGRPFSDPHETCRQKRVEAARDPLIWLAQGPTSDRLQAEAMPARNSVPGRATYASFLVLTGKAEVSPTRTPTFHDEPLERADSGFFEL